MVTDWIKRFEGLPPMLPDGALALLLLVSAGLAAYQDAGKLNRHSGGVPSRSSPCR